MDVASTLQDTINLLKPFRPPTVTSKEIAKEQTDIEAIVNARLLVAQVALITVVVAMVEYIVLPVKYANPLALLTLSVGVAVGIFLAK